MAVSKIQVFKLGVEAQFEGLTATEKRYAHHMARAAWYGTRIILRQVSPEAPDIFDFILELHRACDGDWDAFTEAREISRDDLHRFLTYAATFLSNVGNYFGSGDQKFIPAVGSDVLQKLAATSPRLSKLCAAISNHIQTTPPFSLGYPAETTQTAYYLGSITEEEISLVSRVLEQNSIFPENTRIRKAENGTDFEVLLASVRTNGTFTTFPLPDGTGSIHLIQGDHAAELEQICAELAEAAKHAANDRQREFLKAYIESFQTGSLDTYRESQRIWVQDKGPRVENIFGFVEPYRDPHGTRAEFEGLVAIADDDETKLLARLVNNSSKFIQRLPWATPENNGKGPFEKNLFEPPDFSSIHTLAYCSSIIFPGINLPNYNDIRQESGFKNVIISNRMAAESRAKQYPFVDPSEADTFSNHKFPAYYWWVVLHELLGHGTGQMMVETEPGKYNFDIGSPPINSLTGEPITCWYKPGQTWTGQFGDLATTVDECRAELVGAYLMDDPELLALFGFTETSGITAEDLTYNLYQQLGVDGLRGLANFNVDSGKWGQAHSRAHFAMLKTLLRDGSGVLRVIHNPSHPTHPLTVHVDRSKIRSHGKPALGAMLLRLHMYRCTADAAACREYYEELSKVDGEYLAWREAVVRARPPPMVFVQANTVVDAEGEVRLREYEETVEGVVKSWVERGV
ncbi:dipeptidyl peptidase 3 [Staphylotrichum tortipilum]|uniref:Dipeptidyl peptidase 3 n=1 Tax=Staphylotrichum tortipilum TaxID=2831512 RepID=A0AAN6RNK3_9PEZI|nr:dipeptidyl peptidase 3 [Staphylotrichum longicolle]